MSSLPAPESRREFARVAAQLSIPVARNGIALAGDRDAGIVVRGNPTVAVILNQIAGNFCPHHVIRNPTKADADAIDSIARDRVVGDGRLYVIEEQHTRGRIAHDRIAPDGDLAVRDHVDAATVLCLRVRSIAFDLVLDNHSF